MIHTISFLIWNESPQMFSFNLFGLPVSIRWYGILFALAFLAGQQVMYYIFKKEEKSKHDVDSLLIYIIFGSIIGARLGHVIFYEPEMIVDSPLSVFLPIVSTSEEDGLFGLPFKIAGFSGLASHGGIIGIMISIVLYAWKNKQMHNYFHIIDRIALVVVLGGSLVRIGNFFNSEIIGTPSQAPTAVVFVNPVSETLKNIRADSPVESVSYRLSALSEGSKQPMAMYLFFKNKISVEEARYFVTNSVQFILRQMPTYIDPSYVSSLNYNIEKLDRGEVVAKIHTVGIARHPTQLYESLWYFCSFILGFWVWSRKKSQTPQNLITGLMMILLASVRIGLEFIKENQVPFEDNLPLNMGQILSLPFLGLGIFLFIRALGRKK